MVVLLLLLLLQLLLLSRTLMLLMCPDDRWVFLLLLTSVGLEVNEVSQVGQRHPNSCGDEQRRSVDLWRVDVSRCGDYCHWIDRGGLWADHSKPAPRSPFTSPLETRIISPVYLAPVVVAAAMHTEEVRATLETTLP